jgi:hypothetical protein
MHLVGFAAELRHQFGCPWQRLTFGDSGTQTSHVQSAVMIIEEMNGGCDGFLGVGIETALDLLPNQRLSLGGNWIDMSSLPPE